MIMFPPSNLGGGIVLTGMRSLPLRASIKLFACGFISKILILQFSPLGSTSCCAFNAASSALTLPNAALFTFEIHSDYGIQFLITAYPVSMILLD